MGRAPKRFIKKVPPSGAAPVFKLTLPHRIVHTHLSHLIDTEFEIAVSATAAQSWQGTIAPRRNKDRSEYTLQGWRLFAEAHRVQPGDQVSFELVSPRRLVVQVISTEEDGVAVQSNSNATSPIQEDNPSPRAGRDLSPIATQLDEVSRRHSWMDAQQDTDMDVQFAQLPGSARSGESLRNAEGSRASKVHLSMFGQEASPSGPAPMRAYPSAMQGNLDSAVSPLDMRHPSLDSPGHRNWQTASSMPSIYRNPAGSSSQTLDGLQGGGGSRQYQQPNLSAGPSSVHLNFQLLNLTSTIQSQQADLQFYEARARKAEYEASQLRILFSELRGSLDMHSRSIMHAGEALEKLSGKLGSPETVTNASPGLAESLMGLQAEMYLQVDKLKSSLLHMMSVEL